MKKQIAVFAAILLCVLPLFSAQADCTYCGSTAMKTADQFCSLCGRPSTKLDNLSPGGGVWTNMGYIPQNWQIPGGIAFEVKETSYVVMNGYSTGTFRVEAGKTYHIGFRSEANSRVAISCRAWTTDYLMVFEKEFKMNANENKECVFIIRPAETSDCMQLILIWGFDENIAHPVPITVKLTDLLVAEVS